MEWITVPEKGFTLREVRTLTNRNVNLSEELEKSVSAILEKVRDGGDDAIRELTKKFDGVELSDFRVTEEEMQEALAQMTPEFLEVLKEAKANIETFHKEQVRKSWTKNFRDGVELGEQFLPIQRVGVYVPGGRAAYPSTVLMDTVPALVAGCPSVAMTTPPGKDGKVNPNILAAAYVAGVKEIYKVGGAQGIAMLAYGTESVEPVFKIVGPGNAFVAMAKRLVFGTVGIDMIAGPSEVCCVADASADPTWIAADLLSQAEHDPRAAVFLITPDADFGKKVEAEMERQMKELSRYEIMKSSVDDYAKAFLCKDAAQCFDIVNKIAPEHLEVELPDPKQYLPLIYNAGAIFLGKYTSEPLGDYMAGPNHTLPTSGTAAFSSPLGVYDFVKHSSVEMYNKEAFQKISKKVQIFAKAEGLTAHAHAMEVRDED
ncbi:MAG: histidinol dehydrogenase [Dialister sp.]|nr:histidinol dehydrogenase [Dialister sp.]